MQPGGCPSASATCRRAALCSNALQRARDSPAHGETKATNTCIGTSRAAVCHAATTKVHAAHAAAAGPKEKVSERPSYPSIWFSFGEKINKHVATRRLHRTTGMHRHELPGELPREMLQPMLSLSFLSASHRGSTPGKSRSVPNENLSIRSAPKGLCQPHQKGGVQKHTVLSGTPDCH